MIRWAVLVVACVVSFAAAADESIGFCYNWSCVNSVVVEFPEPFLRELADRVLDADSPLHERELIAAAVGRVFASAGERSPIGADRAGNVADAEVDGRMDCIDHSTNTTAILKLFEKRAWLRFHRVGEPVFRSRFVFPVHRAAVIEELPPGLGVVGGDGNEQFVGARFVVDSWLVDPGKPPVVLPQQEWLNWGGPDVE